MLPKLKTFKIEYGMHPKRPLKNCVATIKAVSTKFAFIFFDRYYNAVPCYISFLDTKTGEFIKRTEIKE